MLALWFVYEPPHEGLITLRCNDKTGAEPTKLRTRPSFLDDPTKLPPHKTCAERDVFFILSPSLYRKTQEPSHSIYHVEYIGASYSLS